MWIFENYLFDLKLQLEGKSWQMAKGSWQGNYNFYQLHTANCQLLRNRLNVTPKP